LCFAYRVQLQLVFPKMRRDGIVMCILVLQYTVKLSLL